VSRQPSIMVAVGDLCCLLIELTFESKSIWMECIYPAWQPNNYQDTSRKLQGEIDDGLYQVVHGGDYPAALTRRRISRSTSQAILAF
jgi:hypothetical protein